MNKIETYTLVSSTPHWNGRTAVVFTVEGNTVTVAYYPNGTSGIPDDSLGVLLEGEHVQANIRQNDPLTRQYAKKVWNRFLEIGFTRV